MLKLLTLLSTDTFFEIPKLDVVLTNSSFVLEASSSSLKSSIYDYNKSLAFFASFFVSFFLIFFR
jgi:hypothetical protein